MTNDQLKKLENDLWASANSLRAYGGIKAADYAVPVLGIIFLRFADNKYSGFEAEIIRELETEKGTRLERPIESIALSKCGFYLPDFARYDYLLQLPGEQSIAAALRRTMEGIELYQDEKFKDVLPKEAFFDIEKKKADILPQLLKTFSDIPRDAGGDIFGRIYEYFLGAFAMSEGQKGGEFFTPTSVVRFIVEVIEPYTGKLYDPACGSGGMFVQSARFIKEASHDISDIYVYGQEYMGETARLAKMNLMVNNIRGEITEVNSYEGDPYNSLGKFDYVMANPPFNVKSVKESTVKNDARFFTYGLPKNKGKNTDDSITDANYLWVSLFATSLNEKGRAGFVMPNSASDAGNSEYEIRKKIVDSGIVDCMVSMPSNMFFTVTLPATLWFLDKHKAVTDRKDKILFIDARNTYYQIDRAHREWKEEHIQNLAIIVRLYRGENSRYLELISHYEQKASEAIRELDVPFTDLQNRIQKSIGSIKSYSSLSGSKRKPEEQKEVEKSGLPGRIEKLMFPILRLPIFSWDQEIPTTNAGQHTFTQQLTSFLNETSALDKSLKAAKDELIAIWAEADKLLKIKADKTWAKFELNNLAKTLDELQQNWKAAFDQVSLWHSNIHWLQSRFPDATYTDVIGLCKLADKTEYADEQDYSLNAGRYVGVELEGDDVTKEEFAMKMIDLKSLLDDLNEKSNQTYDKISQSLKEILS